MAYRNTPIGREKQKEQDQRLLGQRLSSLIAPNLSKAGDTSLQARPSTTDTLPAMAQRERDAMLATPAGRRAVLTNAAQQSAARLSGQQATAKRLGLRGSIPTAPAGIGDSVRMAEQAAAQQRKARSEQLANDYRRTQNAERVIWEADDARKRLQALRPDIMAKALRQSGASIPLRGYGDALTANPTTGNLARQSFVQNRVGQVDDAIKILGKTIQQPSITDNFMRQFQKQIARQGPESALPVVPLAKFAKELAVGEHGASASDSPLVAAAQRGLSTAKNTPVGMGPGGWAGVGVPLLTSTYGDAKLAAPLMHAMGLGRGAGNFAEMSTDMALRRVAPVLERMGVEGGGETIARNVPRIAEGAYETGVHAPVPLTEKTIASTLESPGVTRGVNLGALRRALQQYGINVQQPPAAIYR